MPSPAAVIKVNKKARKLFNPGVKSVALWGHQYKGVAPGELGKYRALMADTMGLQKAGGCTTTAIALRPRTERTLYLPGSNRGSGHMVKGLAEAGRHAFGDKKKVWRKLLPKMRTPPNGGDSRWGQKVQA
jgi:hypothetical protein